MSIIFPKVFNKIKCKYGHDNKKCEKSRIKYKNWKCSLKYKNFKDDLIEYKRLCCNKNYQQKFDEKLKKRLFNTYNFSSHDNNKFILLLQNVIYSYGYMDH